MINVFLAISLLAMVACSEVVDSKVVNGIEFAENDTSIIHVKAFELPVSALMTEESQRALDLQKEMMSSFVDALAQCPPLLEIDLQSRYHTLSDLRGLIYCIRED